MKYNGKIVKMASFHKNLKSFLNTFFFSILESNGVPTWSTPLACWMISCQCILNYTKIAPKIEPTLSKDITKNKIITYGSERGNDYDKLSLITLTYRHGSIDRIQIEACLYSRPANLSIFCT